MCLWPGDLLKLAASLLGFFTASLKLKVMETPLVVCNYTGIRSICAYMCIIFICKYKTNIYIFFLFATVNVILMFTTPSWQTTTNPHKRNGSAKTLPKRHSKVHAKVPPMPGSREVPNRIVPRRVGPWRMADFYLQQFRDPGWLIGILIVAYCDPYIPR